MKKENSNKLNKKGFTLIELLVAILIVGILAAVALPQYRLATLKAKYARAKQTATDIRRAYELYYTVHNEFPTKFSDLDFANKFDESYEMQTNDYYCSFNNSTNEIFCSINNAVKLRYLINFYTRDHKKITTSCRATKNTSDIYNRVCQLETGKTAEQASCSSSASYCNYLY